MAIYTLHTVVLPMAYKKLENNWITINRKEYSNIIMLCNIYLDFCYPDKITLYTNTKIPKQKK